MSNYWQNKLNELNEQEKKKKKKNEDIAPVATSNSSNNYWENKLNELNESEKQKKANALGIDTFDKDFHTTTQKINSIYGNWQDAQTMKTTKASVQNMYDRLGRMDEYNKTYGDGSVDFSEALKFYKSSLDNWDTVDSEYRQYATADDYNKAREQAIERQKNNERSLDDYDAEIKELEEKQKKAQENADNVSYAGLTGKAKARARGKKNKYQNEADAIGEQLATLRKQKYEAEKYQENVKWFSVTDTNSENYDADFEKYAEIGANIENPSYSDAQGWAYIFGWQPGAEDINNIVTFSRENIDTIEQAMMVGNNGVDDDAIPGVYNYKFLTEEEVKLHNYYLAKDKEDGTNNAEKFLKSMEDELKAREGQFIAGNMKGNTLAELLYAPTVGFDQFRQGIESLFSSEEGYTPPTRAEVAGQIIREDLADRPIAQTVYDLEVSVANMAPSILAGAAANYVLPGSGVYVSAATMGASAKGNAYQEKINEGWSADEASTYSTLVGVSEAGMSMAFSKVFGGKAISGKVQKAIDGIDNGLARFAANYGYAAVSEGFEEAAQEVLNPLYENIALGYDKNGFEDIDWEQVAYNGLLGALSGGMFETAGQGVNKLTGNTLTKQEKAVVDKAVELRIAELEVDGKKLKQTEKDEIRNEVIQQMNEGELSLDTIEEILGGETYQTYQDTVANEEALQNEFNELNQMKQGDMTGEQIDRRTELKEQLSELKTNSNKDSLKTKLSEEVFGIVKDSRLAESYVQNQKQGTAFTADLSKYDAKQAEVVKRAIDSGILNDTRRTHKFVDMIAKISADKGVLFDFTNNKRLKESGFAIDGTIVNGYVTKDGITLNVESAKYLNTVVGHEITHVLEEATDKTFYNEFQKIAFEYAEAKGEYQSRYDAIAKLYKTNDDAKIKSELVADLAGDYLFVDSEFIRNLSVKHRNLFQKIYDEIKYMCKVATAGSKEARELERVKKAFEDAYRTEGKGVDGVKHSLSDSDGKQLSKEQQDFFKDSKMRDENGNLKVMYHGSQNAGFHVFDAKMSDDDTSFFFVDRNDVAASYSGTSETYEAQTIRTAEDMNNFLAKIGYDNYEAVEKDGKFELLENDEHVAYSDTAQGIYEEFCWYEGVGEGDANYKVYLNLKNPLVVDGKGRPWNKIDAEFSQEVYDKYQSLTAEEKDALRDLAEWEDFSLFNREIQEAKDNELASAYKKMGEDVNIYDLFSVAADNFSEESLKENSRKYLKTRDYAQRAKEQGYDGVIFNNIIDNGGYSNGSEGASTVAIAFESNQIKSVANEKPTSNPDIRYSLSSMANTFYGNADMSANDFMKLDYTQTEGYKNYVDQCINNMKQTRADFDENTARAEIENSIEGILRVAVAAKKAGYDIYDDASKRDVKDSKNRLLFSSLEPNSDYFTSNDISTICDKRKNFADIYDDIVRAEEAKGVPQGKRFFDNVDNYFYLHNIMAEKGLTQPCRQCYVESMRKNLAPMANAFLRLIGETDANNTANDQLYEQKGKNKGKLKSNNAELRTRVLETFAEYGMSASDLTIEKLTTEDGLAQLKIQAPLIYEAFNSFYGQSKPKMPKSATPFRFGELTALLTDHNGKIKQSLVDKINSTGGFRLQSYSDFQIQNYTDVLQVIFEAGTLGLNGHAYTKVPAFLEATEGTNLKRNISIFMYKDGNEWKLDKNDSFPAESLEEIYKIVEADKSGNTGIIAVSQNAEMSAWVMANDKIAYFIPFHKSGMKMGTVRDTDVKTEDGRKVKGYSETIDHTKQQTEVWANTTADHKALTKVKKGIDIYSFWDFDNKTNLSKNELIEKNVKAYIDACEEAGYLPKFRNYVLNNSKVLNDVLKYSKELGFASPDATIEDISFEYKGYTIPYGYYKCLGDFSMFTPDGKASPHDTLSLENYDFGKAEQFFADSETLHRNEILQQFANDGEREIYRNSNLTAEQLTELVKQKRSEVVDSVVAPTLSLSAENEAPIKRGNYNVYGKDIALKQEEIAPIQEQTTETTETVENMFPDSLAPTEELDSLYQRRNELENSLMELSESEDFSEEEFERLNNEYKAVETRIAELESEISNTESGRLNSIEDTDAPPEIDAPYVDANTSVTATNPFADRDIAEVGNQKVKAYMYENPEVKPFFQDAALGMLSDLNASTKGERYYIPEGKPGTYGAESYYQFEGVSRHTTDDIAELIDVYKYSYAQIEKGLNAIIEDNGAENNAVSKRIEFMLNDRLMKGYTDIDGRPIPADESYINLIKEKQITEYSEEAFNNFMQNAEQYAPFDESSVKKTTAPIAEESAPLYEAQQRKGVVEGQQAMFEEPETPKKLTRAEHHSNIIDRIKNAFKAKGFDLDNVLKKAKNLSTFATVDNTPQRVMEKSLGYKEGQILADETVNKVAQNETEGIKWLNSFTDRKNGLLAQISKQYNIKPGSKESAAAQMYAEGFYVAENNDIIQYGDAELAQDFPNAKVRANIKGLVNDPRIRQVYDETLKMINESRVRNAYPEIPRLENYFLHFRAMEDTFSKMGLPFNPNDIRAKDLPTDSNGVTADLKPGQPYFASAMHRNGKRTSFDLLGGLERYLSSAKNQIYHIDDIQTLRALRNYIADTFGQGTGLEGLDALSEEEQQERIQQVYGSHLSTFAKFLNEEANIIAGKTSLIDRGIEGVLGRRAFTFLDTINKQVGSNMVGLNVSSSLTNFLAGVQAIAKTNKLATIKALAQTTSSKVGSIFGKTDSFVENNPTIIRRKGAERFYRTPYQKIGDAGYVLMSAVDNITTEFIVRAKYNEFIQKGMSEQQAIIETDKWTSRLMADRSLGQMPQLYNSKALGLITKFQLEVRNQLDNQFYDTIQEEKLSNKDIENGLVRNAKTAAKVTATFFELAVLQHLFGKAFESVAGYNPAFDIISVIATALGFDDDEESEDTALDNIQQGFLELLEDLPYTSVITGGRIPMSAALPDIAGIVKGKDEYGNDVSLGENLWANFKEIAPYYVLPTGYGQIKKTVQGLSMFDTDEEHPIAGSYTDSGNIRFPVEDTIGNRVQAGIFGQYANENARDYFDNERKPLNEGQIQEYSSLGLSYNDYWAYRDDMTEISERAEEEGASKRDIIKAKYIDSISSQMSKIRSEKLEILDDTSLTAKEKEAKINELDKQYTELAKERYENYNDVSFDGDYAHIGNSYYQWYTPEEGDPNWRKLDDAQTTKYLVTKDAGNAHYATNGIVHYRRDEEGKWVKISDYDLERQNEVTKALGITPEEYWSETEISFIPKKEGEYEYAYENPEKYEFLNEIGVSYDDYANADEETKEAYSWAYNNPEKYTLSKAVASDVVEYRKYTKGLSEIKADKDKNGNSISGSRKEKVIDYVNSLDIDYGERLILFKNEYNADDTYNQDIIDYLNGRDDISYSEMVTILTELGFYVDRNGNIFW